MSESSDNNQEHGPMSQFHHHMPMHENESDKEGSFQQLFSEYMAKIQKRNALTMGVASSLMTFLTAPMLTLSTSLQLSILSNRKSFNDFKTSTDQGKSARLLGGQGVGKDASSQAGRIQQLRTRMVELPFRPPAYNGYVECTHSLFRQGMLSFYKGNGIRCTHMMLFQYLRTDLSLRVDKYTGGNFGKNMPLLKEFLVATAADFILHPLHLAEARFILQNRHMNLCEYPGVLSFFKQCYGEMWRGIFLHIPRNLCMALSGVSYLNSVDYRLFYLQNLLMHAVAYPFLTIQRRMECQSRKQSSMLPQLYRHSFDAAKQIIKQEGFRALYKGYTLNCLAIIIWVSTVPAIAQLGILNSPWADRDDRDIKFKNEPEYEEDLDDIKDEDLRAAAKSDIS